MMIDDQMRHDCEVRWCVRNFYPDGPRMAAQLDLVERRRGKAAAERLRVDVRAAWKAELDSARNSSSQQIRIEMHAERAKREAA